MLCISPFRRPRFEHGCGQCLPCRINRRRTWAARIVLESLACRESSFATLTYSEDHLPAHGSLENDHWREFTKGIGVRYFGCGEYGDRFGRPHYHLVLFGLGALDAERLCLERWPYGFSQVRPFAFEHGSYVAAYTTKKLSKVDDERLGEGQVPEFARMSRRPGIGVLGLRPIVEWLYTAAGSRYMAEFRDVPQVVSINRSVYPIGRTLVKKLREEVGIPQDDPLRTWTREQQFKASRLCPSANALREKKRVGRYEILRARAARPRGQL